VVIPEVPVYSAHTLKEAIEIKTFDRSAEVEGIRQLGEWIADDGPVVSFIDLSIGNAIGTADILELDISRTQGRKLRRRCGNLIFIPEVTFRDQAVVRLDGMARQVDMPPSIGEP